MVTEYHKLDLMQKSAIRYLVYIWKLVDKRPSKIDSWYPCHVQMLSAMRKMRKIILSTELPPIMKRYLLSPITDYDMLEKHAFDFYCDFEDHPSEYLAPFIWDLEKKTCKPKAKNKKPTHKKKSRH